jgi:RNA polymerase sigma factor (sigma-70 family)
MGQLTARQRAALVLRFYEDLSEHEVAQILKCRPGTVKSLVSRGLETLRNDIRGEGR